MTSQAKRDAAFLQTVRMMIASGIRDFDRQTVVGLLAVCDRDWTRFESLAMDAIDGPGRLERLIRHIAERQPDGLVTPDLMREQIDEENSTEPPDGT